MCAELWGQRVVGQFFESGQGGNGSIAVGKRGARYM